MRTSDLRALDKLLSTLDGSDDELEHLRAAVARELETRRRKLAEAREDRRIARARAWYERDTYGCLDWMDAARAMWARQDEERKAAGRARRAAGQ